MKKNVNLIVVSVIGVILLVLWLISYCSSESERKVAVEEPEQVVPKVKINQIKGYRKETLNLSDVLPEEEPTDEGFLSVDGTDSVEFVTDILAGRPYRIIIEGERRIPLCKLLDAKGDSADWDYSSQLLKFSNDTVVMARLLIGEKVFPFGISEDVDSIPEKDFCNVSFAEISENTQDSIHSGRTKFPILGSATILFHNASEKSDKLYLKVKQPGLLSVTVVYDESVCGLPMFWDNDSIQFAEPVENDTIQNPNSENETIARVIKN